MLYNYTVDYGFGPYGTGQFTSSGMTCMEPELYMFFLNDEYKIHWLNKRNNVVDIWIRNVSLDKKGNKIYEYINGNAKITAVPIY